MNPITSYLVLENLPPVLIKIIVLYHTVPYREEIISQTPREYKWYSALDQYRFYRKIAFGSVIQLALSDLYIDHNKNSKCFAINEVFPYNLNGRMCCNHHSNNRINYNYCIYHKEWSFGWCESCSKMKNLEHVHNHDWKNWVKKVWKERREIPSIETFDPNE